MSDFRYVLPEFGFYKCTWSSYHIEWQRKQIDMIHTLISAQDSNLPFIQFAPFYIILPAPYVGFLQRCMKSCGHRASGLCSIVQQHSKNNRVCEIYRHVCVAGGAGNCRSDRLKWHLKLVVPHCDLNPCLFYFNICLSQHKCPSWKRFTRQSKHLLKKSFCPNAKWTEELKVALSSW